MHGSLAIRATEGYAIGSFSNNFVCISSTIFVCPSSTARYNGDVPVPLRGTQTSSGSSSKSSLIMSTLPKRIAPGNAVSPVLFSLLSIAAVAAAADPSAVHFLRWMSFLTGRGGGVQRRVAVAVGRDEELHGPAAAAYDIRALEEVFCVVGAGGSHHVEGGVPLVCEPCQWR